ncbi:hypothetical protein V6Z12_A01G168800 [Gossypium hirsutum]
MVVLSKVDCLESQLEKLQLRFLHHFSLNALEKELEMIFDENF